MSVQETVTNTIPGLLGSATGLFAGIIAVAALWFGIDCLLSALDFDLPLRQVMFGRNLNALKLYGRYLYAVAGTYVWQRLRLPRSGVLGSSLGLRNGPLIIADRSQAPVRQIHAPATLERSERLRKRHEELPAELFVTG